MLQDCSLLEVELHSTFTMANMSLIELIMYSQYMSFPKLSKLSGIKSKRLHQIIDEGNLATKKETEKLSKALGIDLINGIRRQHGKTS